MTMRLGRPGINRGGSMGGSKASTAIPLERLLSGWIVCWFERRGRIEHGTGRLLLFGLMKRATGWIKGLMKLYLRVRETKEDSRFSSRTLEQ